MQSGYLTAAGRSLEWALWSPGSGGISGPVIVLLHEGLGSVAQWRDFPERLAATTGLTVFAYSRAGYGQSEACALPRPLDYMTQEALGVLPEVLDFLTTTIGADQLVLMGHSDGATIAAEYAGRVADHRVRGLVLMAPHFFTEPKGLAEIAAARDSFDTGLRARLARFHKDVDLAFRGWNDVWLDPGYADWDVTEVIDYLRVPVLAIQGRDDQYGTLAQIQVIEDRCYAPVDVVLVPGRHAPHVDARAQVLAAVGGYCARLQRIEQAQVVPV